MKRAQSQKLLIAAFIITVMHHADHILRIDHSGWPFLSRITPFTYSLLVYPIFLSIALTKSKTWYRIIATAILFFSATLAHILFEPLRDKFQTWTYGSNLPGHIGEQNLLGQNSKVLGVCSIALALLLSFMLLMALFSLIKEVRQKK